jgi:hypothetical protein
MDMYVANKPAQAHVSGLPNITFELNPVFLQGSQMPLWGRADLLTVFALHLADKRQEFSLIHP